MCEKRTRRTKRGSLITRLREARRMQRIQLMTSRTPVAVPQAAPCPQHTVDKVAQNRVIIELAWKTVALMHKNRIIQQKIVALQKETSEFVASVMNNPDNQRRYLENLRLHRSNPQNEKIMENNNIQIKLEPQL